MIGLKMFCIFLYSCYIYFLRKGRGMTIWWSTIYTRRRGVTIRWSTIHTSRVVFFSCNVIRVSAFTDKTTELLSTFFAFVWICRIGATQGMAICFDAIFNLQEAHPTLFRHMLKVFRTLEFTYCQHQ